MTGFLELLKDIITLVCSAGAIAVCFFSLITFGHKLSRLFTASHVCFILGASIQFVFTSLPFVWDGEIHVTMDHPWWSEVLVNVGMVGSLISYMRHRWKTQHLPHLG